VAEFEHSSLCYHSSLSAAAFAFCAVRCALNIRANLRHRERRALLSASASPERRLCTPSNLCGLAGDLRTHVYDIDAVSSLRSGEDIVQDTTSHERRDVVPPPSSANSNCRLLLEQTSALERIYGLHGILELIWRIRAQPDKYAIVN
jgi:hypothetical protein